MSGQTWRKPIMWLHNWHSDFMSYIITFLNKYQDNETDIFNKNPISKPKHDLSGVQKDIILFSFKAEN